MADRMMYEPTGRAAKAKPLAEQPPLPSDEEIKALWAKSHHGKTRGWGIMKRDWASSRLTGSREYQLGIWQGRVDKLRGLEYSEERNENAYNLGYYRGYTNFESDFGGFDRQTRGRFIEKYGVK